MKSKMFEVKARAGVITFAVLITCHLPLVTSTAQTFTQQVQKNHAGEGTVTIHHDADIDRLVNGTSSAKVATEAKTSTPASKPVAKAGANGATAATTTHGATTAAEAKKDAAKATPKTENPKAEEKASKPKAEEKASKPKAEKSKSKPQDDTTKAKPQDDTTRHQTAKPVTTVPDTPSETVPRTPEDTTTVVPSSRHGYKTTGYRVQAFAGGNTRNDRQKAERTGNAMRQLFPGEDVYVRFYSPRWVCRVGNYRTYEEAHEKLLMIRKMGYETATIVKGKIIVYNP
mgnify:CR=1 FL=1